MVDEGATFEKAFVTTPVCCPSRASILTGLYLHNTGTYNNSVSGNCSSQNWRDGPEKRAFVTYLKQKVNQIALPAYYYLIRLCSINGIFRIYLQKVALILL